MHATRASIIIPTLNRNAMLVATVGYFLRQIKASDEIIVIDQTDAPSQDVLDLPKTDKRIQYLHITEKGLPNARNVGVQNAKGEIIVFCDDDVIPQAGFIEGHVKAYGDPGVGAVAGRVIIPGQKENEPGRFGSIRQFDFRIIADFRSSQRKYVDHGQGCNISVRHSLYQGGLQSDIRFGGSAHLEETDLSLQITKKGYKILYEPEAALVHLVEKQGGCRIPNMKKWLYWYGHNYMLLFLKHGLRRYLFFFLFARVGKLILTAIRFCNPFFLTSGLKGLLDGFRIYFTSYDGDLD